VSERRPLSNNNKLLSLAHKVHRLTLVVVYIYSSKIHNFILVEDVSFNNSLNFSRHSCSVI